MEDDIEKVLETKREWRKADRRQAERRQKIGTPEDRMLLSSILRKGKDTLKKRDYCPCSICTPVGRMSFWQWLGHIFS